MAGRDVFSDMQTEELKQLFELVDGDKDGKISVQHELKQVIQDISGKRVTADEIKSISKEYGMYIEFPDMLDVIADMSISDVSFSREELLRAFKVFDPDGKGYIPAAEMRGVLRHLGSKMSAREAEEIIFLSPGDGKVDYVEFIKLLVPE
jgi:calmodulin